MKPLVLLLSLGFVLPVFGQEKVEVPVKQDVITISSETTRITGPLKPDGRVDYAAYLNNKASEGIASPEDNACVWYWRAVGPNHFPSEPEKKAIVAQLGVDVFESRGPWLIDMSEFGNLLVRAGRIDHWQIFTNRWGETAAKPWKRADYPLVAEWHELNRPALEQVERAAQCDRYHNPPSDPELLMASFSPLLKHHREMARMLSSRVQLHAGEGDYAAACRDVVTMYRIARHSGQGGTLVEGLVGASISSVTKHTMEDLITRSDIPALYLAQLQRELNQFGPVYDPVEIMSESERILTLAYLQDCATGNGQGVELILEQLESPPAIRRLQAELLNSDVNWNAVMSKVNAHYDRLVAAMKIPNQADRELELTAMRVDLEQRLPLQDSRLALAVAAFVPDVRDQIVSDLMVTTLMPAIWQAQEAWNRAEVRRRVAPLGCAIVRYQRLHGKYPESLDDLVPNFVEKLPLDPYSDKPFHYRTNAKRTQFAVFTFGPNGIDDNGQTWGEGNQTDDMGMHSSGW